MFFLIGLLLLGAAGLFFVGHDLDRGMHWAEPACRQAPYFCTSPYWPLIAGGAFILLSPFRKAFKA